MNWRKIGGELRRKVRRRRLGDDLNWEGKSNRHVLGFLISARKIEF